MNEWNEITGGGIYGLNREKERLMKDNKTKTKLSTKCTTTLRFVAVLNGKKFEFEFSECFQTKHIS